MVRPSIRYPRTGFVESGADELSSTLGTIRPNPTFLRSGRRRPEVSYGFDCTCAGSRVTGARTGGAGATLPWKVRPTTTVSIAPFWSGAIVRGTF